MTKMDTSRPDSSSPMAVEHSYRFPRMSSDTERLVIVVRADPVMCGHSTEARNLAETALVRGIKDVRIVTWPLESLQKLPLKNLESVLPYSEGIKVERAEPVGDYKLPDGRFQTAMTGRLIELFTDGVKTAVLSLYLAPHAYCVMEALAVANRICDNVQVTTYAEIVGSDITNVVRRCVEKGLLGAAAHAFVTYLSHDHCVAVSEYTKHVICQAARDVDKALNTSFAEECSRRVRISYPAIDAASFTSITNEEVDQCLEGRGLTRGKYVLFLSRMTRAKGASDLIKGFSASRMAEDIKLVVAGRGNAVEECKRLARQLRLGERCMFLEDVGDYEKPRLMAGCVAYVLPSKPRPEFTETFGIALAENMLAGGGQVITCATGGIPEAVGPHATIVPVESPFAIANALNDLMENHSEEERRAKREAARQYALNFDRHRVFDNLFGTVPAKPVNEIGLTMK